MNEQPMTHSEDRPALVLGGGGAFGVVQAAYIFAAYEAGFRPQIVVGTSVGALNGAWVALHPDDPQGLLRVWLGLDRLRVLRINPLRVMRNVLRGELSLFTNHVVPRLIADHIGDARFEDTQLPFAAVATNMSRWRKRAFDRGPMGPAIMASTAIPGMFDPVRLDDELYVDGGLTAPVDLATAHAMGATEILAIALNPAPASQAPRSVYGVLKQSYGILSRASMDAMEECLSPQLPVRLVEPDLSRHSPWRLDDSAAAIAHNVELARREIRHVLGADGHVLPGARRQCSAAEAVEAGRRWVPRLAPTLQRLLPAKGRTSPAGY